MQSSSSPSREQSRSPTTSVGFNNAGIANSSSATATATGSHLHPSTPHKQAHPHPHPHLPVGHSHHSPAQSASGEPVQGKASEAGGIHTSTSRGTILLPPSTTNSALNTPVDLLSVSSASAVNSRPGSPPSAAAAPSAPSSPTLGGSGAAARTDAFTSSLSSSASRPTSPSRSPVIQATNTGATGTRSPRPFHGISAAAPHSPTPFSSSPSAHAQLHQHQQDRDNTDALSSSASQILDSSAVFERDVEHAQDHLLTGSEAIDLAAAPVLSEVALAVVSNDPVPTGGATSGNINNINSLDSALFAAGASTQSQSQSQSQAQSPYFSGGNAVLMSDRQLSEEGRKSSSTAAAQSFGTGNGNGRPLSGESEFSPPPSLSLSPSATGSPISSGPVSPVQLLSGSHHQHQHNNSGGSQAGISHNMSNSTSSGQGLTSGQYDGHEGDSALLTGHGFDGATAGSHSGATSGMNSPLGSALGGISLSGSKDSKRRLSMISYADIINSERLPDSHSGFSSPAPSSALSLSGAALPLQSSPFVGTPVASPGLLGGAASETFTGVANAESQSGLSSNRELDHHQADTGRSSAATMSPERELSPGVNNEDSTSSTGSFVHVPSSSKPGNYRTDTTSTIASESFYMPGQLPMHTPMESTGARSAHIMDEDVTPTHSKIRREIATAGSANEQEEEGSELKQSTSSSSSSAGGGWSMVEMGKALVGSAAGAVGSVLGTNSSTVDDHKKHEEGRTA